MDIDFVIAWVDGADPAWRAEFSRYRAADGAAAGELTDASVSRYRDWDNLHYWFRAVERFAPWVRRIHFITWGHLPAWLDAAHPKLHVVRHEEILDAAYRPTFNINPLELSLHRIPGLAERFVFFNDDMFLGRPVGPERFFRCGLPCDAARLSVIAPSSIAHILLNDVALINRRHRKQVLRQFGKWFNLRYSLADMFKSLTLLPWSAFAGFKDPHMPQPFLKATFERLWAEEGETLGGTLPHRFRSLLDFNQYLMRYEQLVTGCFAPVSYRDARLDTLGEQSIEHICRFIAGRRYAMFCLNDSEAIADFDALRARLCSAFQQILPEKSSYEL
ncbi:MAG: Stealth CR1 domain-containing protein [Rikenellaceae bacterium]|jgi:hypothetical protein|nr:Stealth CR1 domain-containing protein [Rikenellaceae bacterium]